MASQPTSPVSRIGGGLRRARRWSRHPSSRALLLALGLALFIALTVQSFRSLPPIDTPAWWAVAILIALTTPLTVALNTAEFKMIASSAGADVGWLRACGTSVVASLANLLPVPGAAVVRTTALVREGVPVGRSAEANLLAAMVWVSATALLAGVALAFESHTSMATGFVLIAVAAVALPVLGLRVRRTSSSAIAAGLIAVEVLTAVLSSVRILLGFRFLRLSIGFGSALVISTSQVLAALIGFAPGGLGLRELLSGVLASMVNADSSNAVAATVVDRVASQAGMILVLLVLVSFPNMPLGSIWRQMRSGGASEETEESR